MPGNELTPEELAEIIAQSAWVPCDTLVYFNPDTGELRYLTGELIADDPYYIRVNPAEVSDLVHTKASPSDYRVVMDFKTNEYILQNILEGDVRSFNWNDEVYQLPNEGTASLKLTQDSVHGTWTLTLTDQVKKSLSTQQLHTNYNLAFYVTKPDDVNVLYSILKFRVIDITTTGSFTITDDSAFEPVSVYCRKVFDSYLHKQI
jgi:hypothetical protein